MANKTGTNVIRVDFTLPKEIATKLENYKKQTLVPKSALVSKLLKEFFDKDQICLKK